MTPEEKRAFYKGIRASIAWLHAEALTMNDAHARTVLNTAALHLGTAKPDPALAAPDGWVVVPREPTEEMSDAGAQSDGVQLEDDDDTIFYPARIYRAMIAAAPHPPEQKD